MPPAIRLPAVPRLLRRSPVDLAIMLVLALMLGTVWTVSVRMEAQIERKGIDTALAETRNLATLLSLNWSVLLQRVDVLHRFARLVTRAHLNSDHSEAELLGELRSSVDLAGSSILQVSSLDPAGDVIWSTLPMPPGRVNLAQREHYLAIARDGRDGIVGRTVRDAVTGRWSIQFAEAVRDPDRTLRGITVVSVDAMSVEALARELSMADRGIISVVRGDGVLLARSPSRGLGEVIPSTITLWRTAWQSSAAEGLVPGSDGTPRFYAARRVVGSDLVVVIGLDAARQMASVYAATAQLRRTASVLGFALTGLALAISIGIRRQRSLTKERQRSHDLAQREALLRHIAAQATDIISLQDSSLCNIFVSPAIRTVLGIEPQHLVGCRFGSPAVTSDAPLVEAALDRLVRTGVPQRFTYQARHTDGDLHWVETEMVAVPGTGDVTGCRYLSISRDITGRKKAEEALRETKEQVERLLNMGPGTLYRLAIGPRGERRFSVPSTGLLEKMGYTAKDMVGCFFMLRAHPADVPVFLDAGKRCLSTGHAVCEYRFPSAANEVRWLRDEMRLAGHEGKWTILVGYLTDVTAEREAAKRLRQAECLATLGEVATGIAHEVNQPLAAIAMAAENGGRALTRDPPDVRIAATKFVRIRDQVSRLGAVIDHIRLFAREQPEQAVAFTLDEVVRNTLLLVQSRLQPMGITVIVALAPGLPQPRGMPILLEQALMNLIGNACDAYADAAQRDGGVAEPCIRISARRDGGAVLLSVADHAGGIPPDLIDRVFDPFFTTKPVGKGTGLGLSISLATITKMGGQLSVRNEAGGAVFEIRLPLAAGTDAAVSGPLTQATMSAS